MYSFVRSDPILTLVFLPSGWQILIFILGIGGIHLRRLLLGIVLHSGIVLLILGLSPLHRNRVQLAVQSTLHVRNASHFCRFVIRLLAITVISHGSRLSHCTSIPYDILCAILTTHFTTRIYSDRYSRLYESKKTAASKQRC